MLLSIFKRGSRSSRVLMLISKFERLKGIETSRYFSEFLFLEPPNQNSEPQNLRVREQIHVLE